MRSAGLSLGDEREGVQRDLGSHWQSRGPSYCASDMATKQIPFCPLIGEEAHKHEQGNTLTQMTELMKLEKGGDNGLRNQLILTSKLN